MDWTAVLEGLRLAVLRSASLTSREIPFADQDVRWVGPDWYISDTTETGVYLRTTGQRNFGAPAVSYTDPSTDPSDPPADQPDLEVATTRQTVWTVQLQIVSLDTTSPGLAASQASDLTAALEAEDLTSVGLALAAVGPTVTSARQLGDYLFEVATLDLVLNLVENRTGQPVAFIATAEVEPVGDLARGTQ